MDIQELLRALAGSGEKRQAPRSLQPYTPAPQAIDINQLLSLLGPQNMGGMGMMNPMMGQQMPMMGQNPQGGQIPPEILQMILGQLNGNNGQ